MLERTAVEMFYGKRREVDIFEAADIDSGHAVTSGVNPLAIRVNAADRAKPVFDDVLVELVGAGVFFRSEQAKPVTRNKPEQRTPTRTLNNCRPAR